MRSDQTILVVEEDASCRAFLADNLAEDGYQVASAETREQALALLANRRAHLVLADLNGQTLGLLDAVRDRHADVWEREVYVQFAPAHRKMPVRMDFTQVQRWWLREIVKEVTWVRMARQGWGRPRRIAR
jgi:DNA-binding NtrC family response regulator